MKIKSIILYAVAVLFASGCSMSKGFEEESQVSFIAYTEVAPESKVTLGTSSSSKPQTFWENSDVISVYTDGGEDPEGYKRTAFPFSTALETPASIARFIYTGNDFVDGNNYLAVYPHRSDARVVKLDAEANEGEVYRFANFTIPTDQTLVAGSFDKNALLMVAYANELQDLHFKNAVALIKFKVADENVTSGQIYSAGSALSGTYICKALEDDMQPKLETYGSGAKYSYVNFALAEGASFIPGVDYYIAVRPDEGTLANPLDQENGFGIKLNGVTVKEYPSVSNFKRNTIYDLGTLSIPDNTLSLTFNFTDADAMAGWPTTEKSQTDPTAQITLPYVLDGVTYNFISSRPLNVTTFGWAYNRGDGLLNPKQCYLGFPVVEDYALTAVHFTVGANNGANYMITGAIAEGTADPVPVAGGETQSDSSATEFTFNLTDTAPGTQYWIKVWSKPSIMTSMTLTYSK